MTSHRDPFGLALATIRRDLRSGRFVLGEQLMITAFAEDLHLSATPIREALSRLAGEGLIEDRRGSGYFAWRLDAIDLIELYGLASAYLAAALKAPGAQAFAPGLSVQGHEVDDAHVARTEAAHGAAIHAAHNLALTRLQALLDDRLAPIRRIEPLVLRSLDRELRELEAATSRADPSGLQQAFGAYYDRRIAAAPDLVSAMRNNRPRPPQI